MLPFFLALYLLSVLVMTVLMVIHLRDERYIDNKVLACAVFMTCMPALNTFLVFDYAWDFYVTHQERKRK